MLLVSQNSGYYRFVQVSSDQSKGMLPNEKI